MFLTLWAHVHQSLTFHYRIFNYVLFVIIIVHVEGGHACPVTLRISNCSLGLYQEGNVFHMGNFAKRSSGFPHLGCHNQCQRREGGESFKVEDSLFTLTNEGVKA